jgi:quinoprotein glucose dehydrogenase
LIFRSTNDKLMVVGFAAGGGGRRSHAVPDPLQPTHESGTMLQPMRRQTRGGRGVVVAALGLLAACGRAQPGSLALEQKYTRWWAYEAEPGATKFSALTQIDRSNVNQLQLAWSYPVGAGGGFPYTPLVVDSMMYVLGQDNSVVALNAATGRPIWTSGPSSVPGSVSARGIMYWESPDRSDRRLLFTKGNNDLVAINALTGAAIPSFGTGGHVDVRQGLGRDTLLIPRATNSSPGVVVGDLVILGSAPGEGYVSGPGHIRAYDVRTGEMRWIFHTLPQPGEFGFDSWPAGGNNWKTNGAANNWGGMSVDEKRGIVYIPLGSATYDFYGVDRIGNNLFANSLVALDVKTGKRLWHFQTVHHDLWDYDLTATPVLLTVRHNGKMVDAVAQATKTGFVFVFDRVTGEPLWPIEERPVPASDMPGEQASPTQPFPTKPEPFVPQSFTEADLNPYIVPAERDSLRNFLRSALNKGLFTPPSTRPTIQTPGNRGGANWGSSAGDPRDGTFYVIAYNMPSVLKLERITPGAVGTGGSPIDRGQAFYQSNCAICHGANRLGQPASRIPSLVGVTNRLSHDEFSDVVHHGRGNMPAFPQISADEFNALQAYLANPELALASSATPGGDASADTGPLRYQSGWNHILDSKGVPAIKPPWFRLTAYDLNEGKMKWQVPLGDVPHLVQQGILNTGSSAWIRGGPAITAGGLIFVVTGDKLRAYDKDTGKELWAGQLPGRGDGTPAVYQAGGRQFVVVSGQSTDALGNPTGSPAAYYTFALPARR